MSFNFRLTAKREEILRELNLTNSFDIVSYLPSRYDNFLPTPLTIENHEKRVVLKGIVVQKGQLIRINPRFQKFTLEVAINSDIYKIIVFNRPYLLVNLHLQDNILVSGKLNYYKKEIVAVDIITKGVETLEVRPRYSLFEGVTNFEFQRLVTLAYLESNNRGDLDEIIPSNYRLKYRLLPRHLSYYQIHFPKTMNEVIQSLRYLKYEELLIYSLMMLKMKAINTNLETHKHKLIQSEYMKTFYHHLPFSLTDSQIEAIKDIKADMISNRLMYRLLQGDVGSGKTIVAIMALAFNYSAGFQGAFMAPTDILARQHYATLQNLFSFDQNIRIVLLTSSLTTKEKKEVYQEIESGKAHIVVGTHALIQEKVNFANLGLAIIDEQHRFGVAQRKALREKGENVEILMMSATPIPRTLAISLYGDMDVSTLSGFPSSRRHVLTQVIKEEAMEDMYTIIEKNAQQKLATFVICPLIEEDSKRKSVLEVFNEFEKRLKNTAKVGIMHGKMANSEKEEVMLQFKNGVIDVLIATTVVEVGIDIKKANIMVIYNADSFGLAQLHQLRGRIGRSGQQAYCYLVCDSENSDSLNRLHYLTDHEDGFDIARFDLATRGQGDIAGVKQSGIFDFNVASIYDDLKILEIARNDAKEIVQNIQVLENKKIIDYVDTLMAKTIAIID